MHLQKIVIKHDRYKRLKFYDAVRSVEVNQESIVAARLYLAGLIRYGRDMGSLIFARQPGWMGII
ncbi:MAG: hypothetical protein POH28_10060 [Acidocella sp.]|nr:hypothetical protein [Acidocella sp.]